MKPTTIGLLALALVLPVVAQRTLKPVYRPPARQAHPLTPQQRQLMEQRQAAARQQLQRALAQMHQQILAREAQYQQSQLQRQVQLHQALLSRVQSPLLRQAIQQHLGELRQTVNRIIATHQPLRISAAGYGMHATPPGGMMRAASGSGTPSGNLNTACPAPVITSLSVASGQPNDPVLINGSNFGAQGTVNFTINPGQTLPGANSQWSDAQVFTSVPAATGIASPYNGVLAVSNSCGQSNMVTFQFVPELTVEPLTLNDILAQWSDPNCPTNPPPPFFAIEYGCGSNQGAFVQILGGGYYSGAKNEDRFNAVHALKNGWVLDSFEFDPSCLNPSCGSSLDGYTLGTNSPAVNVHSWVDANQFEGYTLTFMIRGPVGVPYQ